MVILMRRWYRFLTVGSAVGCGTLFAPLAGQDLAPAARVMERPPVYALNGVVCTSNALASQAGLRILEAGGNAFDAAVAAAAVLNVVEPMMTGIGGDMFVLAWVEQEQRFIGLNGSGRSGARFTAQALRAAGHETMPPTGAATVTVPGALSGWADLLQRYGTISLAEALEPARRLAEDGFLIAPTIGELWQYGHGELKQVAARAAFSAADGKSPGPGMYHRNPHLAQTFTNIAKHGPGWLYGGELGRRLVEFVAAEGGFLTLDDLASHQSLWVEPIAARFGDYALWELPPNGQGVAALQMIRMLDTAEFRALPHHSAAYLHHLIEVKKVAFADLAAAVADPDTMRVSVEHLLSDELVVRRRAEVDPRGARAPVQPDPSLLATDTTYLSTADRHGNMVSFINSICSLFGSGLVVPGTGFALQNRGVGFTLEEGKVNTVAPRRRPFHTIIPGFISRRDASGRDAPWATVGVIGGDNQPPAHVQVFLALAHFGLNPQQALDAPRFRHTRDRRVFVESRLPAEVLAELAALGHELQPAKYQPSDYYGVGQVIRRLERGYEAGSDSRGDGLPAAY